MTEWKQTACILCECNCGIEVELEGRTLSRIRGDRAHPASQGYTCNKAMRLDHYQNGRHRLTEPDAPPARRDLRGDRLGHRDRRDRRRPRRGSATSTAASRSSTTAAAGRATTSAAPTRAPSCARSARATAPARSRRRRPASSGSTRTSTAATPAATSSTPRSSVFVGKNPWKSQSFPRARVTLKRDRQGPRALDDRDRPGGHRDREMADFHLRVRPGTDAWCLAALAAVARPGGPRSTTTSSPSTRRGAEPVLAALARGRRSPSTPSAAASTRS